MSFDRRVLAASLAFLIVAAVVGAAVAQQSAPAGKTPRAVVPELTANLGSVLEGQTFEYVFKVRNTGGAELQILSVRPG